MPTEALDHKRREAELLFKRIGINLCGLWRRRRSGTADPVRSDSAHHRRR